MSAMLPGLAALENTSASRAAVRRERGSEVRQSIASISASPASPPSPRITKSEIKNLSNSSAQRPAKAAGSEAGKDKQEDSQKPAFRDGVVLMAFKPNTTQEQQTQILAKAGAAQGKLIGQGVHVLRVPSGRVIEVIQLLLSSPEVRYAEPDFRHSLNGAPNDPGFPQQWAFRNTGQNVNGVSGTSGADEGALRAWTVTTGSSSVVVAVTDTGIDYNHPDLAANVWSNPGGINGCAGGTHGYNVLKSSCDPMDDDTVYNGHGTHVAGIIGAVTNNGVGVAGVNWQTSLMGVKWVDAKGNGFTSDLISALDWVIQAKQAGVNVRVVNDSQTWPGTAASQALSDEIDALGSNDILFVTAAGNTAQNNDTTPRYPCVYDRPNQICAAASDQNDQLWSSSNYGAQTVDLAAPGVNILSTLRNGSYGLISGCSMSAAQVSGAAALVLATGYQSVTSLKAALLSAVDLLPEFTSTTRSGGRLDICKAISGCAAANPPPAVSTTSLPNGMVGSAYNATLNATGGTPPYTWTESGTLPPSLALSTSGNLSGTPTAAGTWNFVVQVTDANSASATQALSVTINSSSMTAITLVQATSGQANGVASLSHKFASANTAGNLIIAFVRMSSTSQTVSVTDSVANVYTDAVAQVQSSDGHQTHIFYAKNIKGGSNTVTAKFSSTNNHPWLAIFEYSGVSTTAPLDRTSSAQGSGTSVSSGTTAQTQAAGELLFSGLGLPSSSTVTMTPGSGYVLEQSDTTSPGSRAATEQGVVSSVGAFSATYSLSGGANWSAVLATFSAAATGGSATLMSIAVTPASTSIVKGTTQQFTAKGTYSDGSTQNLTNTVAWSSSNTAVATINSTGLASGVGPGSNTIQAASGTVTGAAQLTVTAPALSSITVTPANQSIPNGTTQQFTATGNYSDGSTQNLTNSVAWSSSNTASATINSTGLATAVGTGSSTIQAVSGSVSGSTVLTVTSTSGNPPTAIGAHAATDNGTTSSTTVVVNITPQIAGSTLFCWTKFVNGSIFVSVVDNVNRGSYQPYNSQMRDNGHNYSIASYYHENVAASPTTVTLTYSPAGTAGQMACLEIQNVPTSYAMDGNFVASIATTSTDPNSGTTITPSGDGQMILSSAQMDSGAPAAGSNYSLLDSASTYFHEYWGQSTATATAGNFTDASLVGYGVMMAAVGRNLGGFCDATQMISWSGGIDGKTPAIADLQGGTYGGAAQPHADQINNAPGWSLVNSASGVTYAAAAYQPFATSITCPFYSGAGAGSLGVSRDTSISAGGGVSYHFDTTQPKVTARACIWTPDIPGNAGGYMDTFMVGGGDNTGNFDFANVILQGNGANLSFASEFKSGTVTSPTIPVTSGSRYGALITYNQTGLHTISYYDGCGPGAPLIGTQTAASATSGGGPADFVGFFSGTAMAFPGGYHVYIGAAKLDILYGGAVGW